MEKQKVENRKRRIRDIENTLMFNIVIKVSERKMIGKKQYFQT